MEVVYVKAKMFPLPQKTFLTRPLRSRSLFSPILLERDIHIYIYIYINIYPGQGLMPVNVCVHFRNFFTLNDYDAPVETVAKAKVLSK